MRTQSQAEPVPVVEQHDYMAGLRKYLEAPQSEAPLPASSCNIDLSALSSVRRLNHNWRTMIGATSAGAILLSDVQQLLRRIQRDIGYRYIKFNGIFSDDMHVYSENAAGEVTYSFAFVDKVFDFLLSVGLRPLIQLSFMPEALAGSHRRLFGYLVSEPSSLEKWSSLISALVRHLQQRYGREELRHWLFSVWEQPDTPDSLFGFSDPGQFRQFYLKSYQAVKSCDPKIPVGSPATFYIVQPGYTNWYVPFLQWCREHGCMPDFLSFHYYDTNFAEDDGGQETFGFAHAMILRDSSDGFNDFVTQILDERHRIGADALPVYLTEWNNTPSQQDLLNDTCFKSCYIAKGILENYDRLDSFAYWSLTDWMGEAPQPAELFFGGLGLFTANGIPKAAYYAFTLLRKLGDTLLGRGEGWFITRQGDSFQILLYNYRHFSHLYAQGERFDMTFTDRYTPFSPERMLDVHLRIRDVEAGTYSVTEAMVNRSSGSSFDVWVAMGATELTEPSELETLTARSVPAISKYSLSAENGVLRLDALLEMLEVRLIRITKQN